MKPNPKMTHQPVACLTIVLLYCLLSVAAISCDSCGQECASACGTRHFRTCCFNYLRKRSSTPPLAAPQSVNAESVSVPVPGKGSDSSAESSPNNIDLNQQQQWLIKSYLQKYRIPWSDMDFLGSGRIMEPSSENEVDYGEAPGKDIWSAKIIDEANNKRNYIVASHGSLSGRFRLPLRSSASDEADDYDGRIPVGVENAAITRPEKARG
ncbi:uncharacterized protein LOC129749184 [Uranotaenia lowii]|uniref:uncharacterized protein LOC129749184 n=1 Tax=Uranotaenia lowii TaxID=190385 RepID=UPI002478F913|nr:uncharacterized protein LOC129749184 [Uranotaenia lowii]